MQKNTRSNFDSSTLTKVKPRLGIDWDNSAQPPVVWNSDVVMRWKRYLEQ